MLDKIRRVDPRILFVGFFLGVFADAFLFQTFMKSPWQLLAAVVGALGTDIGFNYLRHRKWTFPQSGLVSSCGSFALISGAAIWPFFALGFLAIYSKHFVTYAGKHIFNPVNFGACLVLFYCNDVVQNGGSTWSGNYFMIPYLIIVGTLLTLVAGRFTISASYLGFFWLLDHFYLGQHLPANITAFAAPPFMLFIFFMISDPKTTPRIWWQQMLFALAVVLIEGAFKMNRIPNGVIWSLLITSGVYGALIPVLKDLLAPGFAVNPVYVSVSGKTDR